MKQTKTFKVSPHSPGQKQIMRAFITPHLREVCVACGTKYGKTFGGSTALSIGMWVRKNKLWRWIAPIYSQSKIGMRYTQKVLPKDTFQSKNDNPPTITMKGTGSRVEFWHAKHPLSLEGEAVSGGNIFDEYAKMPETVDVSARTTTSQTRAPSLYLSTPLGKNHFYIKCMNAKDKMEWCLKNDKPLTHIFIQARTEDNRFVPRETITEAREELPERLYRMYYEAEFVDDHSVFAGFKDCVDDGEPIDKIQHGRQFWLDDNPQDRKVVIGADWGKMSDYTVFGAIDYEKKRLVGFQKFNKMAYTDAVKQLYYFGKNFKHVGLLNHDMTGVGQAVDDMIAQVNLPSQGVTFTNKLKSDMVNQLILAFQKKELSLPNWPDMVRELDAFEVTTTAVGNFRYAAPEGSGIHDDIVCMLLLAWSAVLEYSGDFAVRFLEDLPEEAGKLSLNQWYSDIIVDDNDSPFPNG